MTIIDVINLLGGLALFLFGLNRMTDNLQAAAGNEMRNILKKLTNTPFKGVLVGIGVTALIQSSSATSVMIIGLVNAGIMTLQQAVGVVMGANIGTTLNAQLIAFNFGEIAYLFVFIGVMGMFVQRSRKMERWSNVIMGFGLLFVGLGVMSRAVLGLQNSPLALETLTKVSSNPILAILVSMSLTMIIQSSSASVGIVMILAKAGLISFEGALYFVYGDNIGTTITAWIASLGSNNTAKRVALVHTLFNVIGTVIFATLTWAGYYTKFINLITPGDVFSEVLTERNIARHIANAHTFFNIFNTMLLLPFAGLLAKIASMLIPKDPEDMVFMGEPKHLNYHLVADSHIAIDQSLKEMREMLRLVRMGLFVSYEAFRDKNYKKQVRISRIEQAIDQLQREITRYLVAINERTRSKTVVQKIPALLHTVNDIEKIGDFIEEINRTLNYQISSQKNPLGQDFRDIIDSFNALVTDMLDLSIDYLEDLKPSYTFKIIEMEGRLDEMHHRLRDNIMLQIQNGECDPEGALNTIDYIDTMEMIADKLINIVEAGTYNFIYQHDVLDTDDQGKVIPHDKKGR
ncbi:MAG: Na/Pi cotransporter family protein [Candidatus Cloacimonetes bacterium]|nr:Na/Pi cotransporter family protein [Candidatus Cloacimonadota bacterium]